MADQSDVDVKSPEFYVAHFDTETKVSVAYYNLVRSKASKKFDPSLAFDLGSALLCSWAKMKQLRDLGKGDFSTDPALACAEHFAFARWITFTDPVVGRLLEIWGVPMYHQIKKGLAAVRVQQSIATGGGAVTPSTPRQERWGRLGVKAGMDFVESFKPKT